MHARMARTSSPIADFRIAKPFAIAKRTLLWPVLARTRSTRMLLSRTLFEDEQTHSARVQTGEGDLRRPFSTGLSGAANTSSFPKKPVKGVDGRLGYVMLNALRVGFGGLCRNSNG